MMPREGDVVRFKDPGQAADYGAAFVVGSIEGLGGDPDMLFLKPLCQCRKCPRWFEVPVFANEVEAYGTYS